MSFTAGDVAGIAWVAGKAGEAGGRSITVNGIYFNLREQGWCGRFVRKCHDAAMHAPDHTWPFDGRTARVMENKLKAGGRRVTKPVPGDVVCVNGGTYWAGHIGIYLGDGYFAENTSSSRGPGTTISRISQVQSRITGYYRGADAVDNPLKVVLLPPDGDEPYGEIVQCNPLVEGGTTRCELRALAEACGFEVTARLSRSRIYLKKKGGD